MKTVFDDLGRDPTATEIIDYVEAHLIKQGKRSISDRTCKYRDDAGNACAVGCLVDDEAAALWDSAIPSGIYTIIDDYETPSWMKKHDKLLKSLQQVHDKSDNWDENGFQGQEDIKYVRQYLT